MWHIATNLICGKRYMEYGGEIISTKVLLVAVEHSGVYSLHLILKLNNPMRAKGGVQGAPESGVHDDIWRQRGQLDDV